MRNVKVFLVLVLRSAGLHKDLIRALTQRWWFDVESEWLRNERNEMMHVWFNHHALSWDVHGVNKAVREHVPEEWNGSSVRRNVNSKFWFRDDDEMEDFMHDLNDDETFQSQRSSQNQPLTDFELSLSQRRKRRNKKIKL